MLLPEMVILYDHRMFTSMHSEYISIICLNGCSPLWYGSGNHNFVKYLKMFFLSSSFIRYNSLSNLLAEMSKEAREERSLIGWKYSSHLKYDSIETMLLVDIFCSWTHSYPYERILLFLLLINRCYGYLHFRII